MQIDLKSMSRKDLEKHLKDVEAALEWAQERDRREAKKAAEKAAAEFGFSLDELDDDTKGQRKQRAKREKKPSVPMYANPSDPSQTWTGKGRQPNWYREAIENGISPEDMKI